MAVDFSLTDLDLRLELRPAQHLARSVATDGTEGNLIRNFQVFILQMIDDEKL